MEKCKVVNTHSTYYPTKPKSLNCVTIATVITTQTVQTVILKYDRLFNEPTLVYYVDHRFSNCGVCRHGGAVGPLRGGGVVCMRDIFI
jgi:hypothetical protein